MPRTNVYLIVAGVMSALISLLHILLAIKPDLYQYIGPGGDALTKMAVQGSGIIILASLLLALIFALWAVYAFSGAGLIKRLPLLRTALIVIGVIYLLRALFLPTEIQMVWNEAYPIRFVIFSKISLLVGAFYLLGIWKGWQTLKPAQTS